MSRNPLSRKGLCGLCNKVLQPYALLYNFFISIRINKVNLFSLLRKAMVEEAVKQEIMEKANTILSSIREEINDIKAHGELDPSLDRKLAAIKSATRELAKVILDKVFRQTRLTDYD